MVHIGLCAIFIISGIADRLYLFTSLDIFGSVGTILYGLWNWVVGTGLYVYGGMIYSLPQIRECNIQGVQKKTCL